MKKERWSLCAPQGVKRASFFPKAAFVGLLLIYTGVEITNAPFYPIKFDQAQVLYILSDYSEKGIIPEHGTLNSRRAFNPPFHVWLYILPSGVAKDPSWVLILPAVLLNVLAMIALYCLAAYYVTPWMGVLASAIYGFSPNGVYFGQSSWAQGLLPAMYAMWLWCVHAWLCHRRDWALVLIVAVPFFMTGVHWGGALAVGALAAVLFVGRRRLKAIYFLVGTVVVAGMWMPYLHFELQRGLADLKATVISKVEIPSASMFTPLCRSEGDAVKGKDSLQGLKADFRKEHPYLYYGFRGVIGAGASLLSNFRKGPWGQLTSPQGSWRGRIIFFAQAALFLSGLWVIIRRRECGLGLLAFCVPSLLQNLSPHPTVSRPDISWMFYGVQVLAISIGVGALAARIPWRSARGALLAGAILALALPEVSGAFHRMEAALAGARGPQRKMVKWIASAARQRGGRDISIRYDFLKEHPEQCWIVSYNTLCPTYYIGAQHDYLLEVLYGVVNIAKAPDGMARDADVVVTFREGLLRYPYAKEEGTTRLFGPYAVIFPSRPIQ